MCKVSITSENQRKRNKWSKEVGERRQSKQKSTLLTLSGLTPIPSMHASLYSLNFSFQLSSTELREFEIIKY